MSGTTALLKRLEDTVAYCRRSAPELVILRAALLPFEDLIHTWSASGEGEMPPPYDEPHFCICTYGQTQPSETVWFTFYRDRITVHITFAAIEGVCDEWDDPTYPITLDGVFDYLRQLPRCVYSFKARDGASDATC